MPHIIAMQEINNSPAMIEIREMQNKIRENLGTSLGMLANVMPKTGSAMEEIALAHRQNQESLQELKNQIGIYDNKDKKK